MTAHGQELPKPVSIAVIDSNPHVFQFLQLILFTLFHNAVIHDWMVSRVPTCKGAQNNEQELFQGFLTELAGLTQGVLYQGSKQVCTEHTRKDNSIAS